MVVNNLVSIVQIYCRHLFPHTKWIICQLSLIKFQNIFDDASGMPRVCQRSDRLPISFGLQASTQNSSTIL